MDRPAFSTDWRRDQSACGGLYLPLFGSHDIDALLWQANDTPKRVWGSVRAISDVSQGDSGEEAFTRQLRLFAEALLENREVSVSGREVLKVMHTLDLVKKASATGQTQVF